MELKIANHFEAQGLGLNFEGIRYYRPKNSWAFGRFNSSFAQSDIIDFLFVEDTVVVSMLEIWISKDKNEIQISFIETSPLYQKQGLASKLYDLLIDWMQTNHPCKQVYRGYPGKDCPQYFTDKLNQKFTDNNIKFYFGGNSHE